MTNLPAPLAPNLDASEREIILAKNGGFMKSLSENDIKKSLLVLIGKSHVQCGYIQDEANTLLSINSLVDTLIKYFGTLSLNEIEKAFQLGIMGEFGEWFGLNNKTYLQWCKGYLGWQKRIEANKKQMIYNAELSKPKELTQAEKDKIVMDGLSVAFENYKKTGKLLDFGNVNYNLLDRIKLIPLTIERKKEFYKQAERNIREALSNSLLSCKESKIKTIKDELENMDKDKVKSEAKNLALVDFFNSLIETDTKITDIL